MVGAAIRRGLLAGLVAGLLAGVFALVVGGPSMDAAIALEEAHGHADGDALARSTQQVGLVVGTVLFGGAVGIAFGLAAAWARGRLVGDAWRRSLKLGAVAVGALVLLPATVYPPDPPGVGDPDIVGARAGLYLTVALSGVLLAAAGRAWVRRVLARGAPRHVAELQVIVAIVLVVGLLVAALPTFAGAGDFPADLLWTFRLSSIVTQVVLWGALALLHGWLDARSEAAAVRTTPSALPV